MTSDSKDRSTGDSSDSDLGERLPFEPGKGKKKKSTPQAAAPAIAAKGDRPPIKKSPKPRPASLEETRIPDVVSQRMVRRMAIFSGVPSVLGMLTFVLSYVVITQDLYDLPNAAVVGTSLGFLVLGGLGLSYGLLSASWTEEDVGSLLGTEQFPTNFGRMREAWKGARQASLAKRRAEADAKQVKGK